MGQSSAADVEKSIGFVQAPGLQSYVAAVGRKLAAGTTRPDLPWAFHVVDDPSPNAFALPGGYIFVTRGLVDLMTNEAELAAVLGHEIGHVTARHSVEQLSRQELAQLGLGIGMAVSPQLAQLGQLANQGLGLLFLKYGRDDERQADALGFKYMVQQGYEPEQMVNVFRALQTFEQACGLEPVAELAREPPRRARAHRQHAKAHRRSAEGVAELCGLPRRLSPARERARIRQ